MAGARTELAIIPGNDSYFLHTAPAQVGRETRRAKNTKFPAAYGITLSEGECRNLEREFSVHILYLPGNLSKMQPFRERVGFDVDKVRTELSMALCHGFPSVRGSGRSRLEIFRCF